MELIVRAILTIILMFGVLYVGIQEYTMFKRISPLLPNLGYILVRPLAALGVCGLAMMSFAAHEAFIGLQIRFPLLIILVGIILLSAACGFFDLEILLFLYELKKEGNIEKVKSLFLTLFYRGYISRLKNMKETM